MPSVSGEERAREESLCDTVKMAGWEGDRRDGVHASAVEKE
jgi:hypothetical protein